MPIINGVINKVSPNSPIVINGGKTGRINANFPYEYDKWRLNWNGNHFAPPEVGSVLYLPGVPGAGSTIQDFSYKFSDSGIDTDEVLDATETGIDCDADATTAIPANSVIIIESEWCFVTATGTTLTVNRGYHGTTATTHATNQDIRVWIPNNGTITGATWTRLSGGLSALSFDGNDYVTIPYNANFNFSKTSSFSMLSWIKTTVGGTAIFGRWANTANAPGYALMLRGSGTLDFQLRVDASDYLRKLSVATVNTGAWLQVGCSYDGSNTLAGMLLYISGALVTSTTTEGAPLTGDITHTDDLNIGANKEGTVSLFNGQSALEEIVPSVLSAATFASFYQNTRGSLGV